MNNLITRLKELEARIYAADAHEAPKYVAQLQDALYEAWPKLLARMEKLEAENAAYVGAVAELHRAQERNRKLVDVVEPIMGHDTQHLLNKVVYLRQTDGEGWAVGEMLRRALKFNRDLAALEGDTDEVD